MNNSMNEFNSIGSSFFLQHQKYIGTTSMPKNHYHNAFELYYLLEGERYYFIKDRTYHITKGDLVFININDIHKTIDAGVPVHERMLINFKKDFLSNIVKDCDDADLFSIFQQNYNVIRLSLSERNLVENILQKMMSENKKNVKGSDLYQKILLSELLLFLSRYTNNLNNSNFEFPNPLHKKISDIIHYLNCNFTDNITLKSISEQFFISQCYLSRSFKEVTGFTFVEYLNNVRTKEAQRLLRETKLNITQIAEKAGYDNTTHFGRVFKSITGFSPLKYRKTSHLPCLSFSAHRI